MGSNFALQGAVNSAEKERMCTSESNFVLQGAVISVDREKECTSGRSFMPRGQQLQERERIRLLSKI